MLTASSCLMVLPLLTAAPQADTAALRVEVDSSRREVVVTAGPFRIAHMPKGMDHGQMHQMEGTTSPLLRFEWPIDAWFRGFELDVSDANGKQLDQRLVHHMNVMNFDRRQLRRFGGRRRLRRFDGLRPGTSCGGGKSYG